MEVFAICYNNCVLLACVILETSLFWLNFTIKGIIKMNFNSYIFVLLFLPLTLMGYFALQEKNKNMLAKLWLIGASLWFYGYFNYSYLILIVGSVLFNYVISKGLAYFRGKMQKKLLLAVGVGVNVGLLFYFKYYDFFVENINVIFKTALPLKNILLPLGISFYTFQQLSYVIDAYRGKANYSIMDYSLFVTFFPQLVAGPIVLHTELIPQIQDETRHKVNYENLSVGLMQFTVGLAKKILIADRLSGIVDIGYSNIYDLTTVEAIIVMISYALQIYFDFSGYSDMAIGLGKMFNFDLPMNFNSPYKANSIIDFWGRWHITLTRFLREYIYFPLGGSRKGIKCTYRNIMIVFLVSGFWHGANWTFVLWGALHGLAEVLQRVFQSVWNRINKFIQWVINFVFLMLTWTIFRAESISQAGQMISRIWLGEKWPICYNTLIKYADIRFMMIAMIIVVLGKNCGEIRFELKKRNAFLTIALLVLCILQFAKTSPFLYFNF